MENLTSENSIINEDNIKPSFPDINNELQINLASIEAIQGQIKDIKEDSNNFQNKIEEQLY